MKIKNNYFIFIFIFNSCALVPSISVPSYIIDSSTNNLKVNTYKGKWLFCKVTITPSIYNEVMTSTKNTLNSKFGERISYFSDSPILIPEKLTFDLDESILTDIKNGNDFDYLILLDVNINKNEFADYSLIPSSDNSSQKQSVSRINIYDLNTKKMIYNKQVKGIIVSNATSGPVYTKNINKLSLKTFNKLLNAFTNDLESFN
ncbi:hypothetical protein [Empedobacter tilapiae]